MTQCCVEASIGGSLHYLESVLERCNATLLNGVQPKQTLKLVALGVKLELVAVEVDQNALTLALHTQVL